MNSQQASGAAIDHDYTEVLTGAEKLTAAEQYIPFLESLTWATANWKIFYM